MATLRETAEEIDRDPDFSLPGDLVERREAIAARLTKSGANPESARRVAGEVVGAPVESARDRRQIRSEVERTRPAARVGRAGSVIVDAATKSNARKVILGVMFGSVVVGSIRDLRTGAAQTTDSVPRRIIGAFMAAILLMVLAGFAPRMAKGLAVLVGLSVIAFQRETIEGISRVLARPAQEGVEITPELQAEEQAEIRRIRSRVRLQSAS